MSKKPQRSPISDFWERVVFTDRQPGCRLPAYAQVEWQALWDAHIAGDHLAQTDPDDAYLLCSIGFRLAHQSGDTPTALKRILRWFDHPQWQQVDENSQDHMLYETARCHLMLGDEANGFARLGELLDRHRQYHPSPARMVHIALKSYCNEQPSQKAAAHELVVLTITLLETYRGMKRWIKYLQSGAVTYGDMLDALGGPFPSATSSDLVSGTPDAVLP
jgi:hypothetical protein